MKRLFKIGAMVSFIIIVCTGCVTQDKAVGLSDGANGFFFRLTGSPTTGSVPAPELWCASNVFSYASAPKVKSGETNAVIFTMSKRRSFFGSLFNVDDTSVTMSYIGAPGESAAETEKRVDSFLKIEAAAKK
jgi:hypothetical protein